MLGLVDSILSMTADVYRQFDTQDPDTGAIKKEWHFYKTIPCHAKGIISNSTTSRSGDIQTFNNRYSNEQSLQIRTQDKITLREKITNIRDQRNNCIWTEIDFPSETPTVFEVFGTTPITDPFGQILGYNSMVRRSENQIIGI
jgi:hypothetical protein